MEAKDEVLNKVKMAKRWRAHCVVIAVMGNRLILVDVLSWRPLIEAETVDTWGFRYNGYEKPMKLKEVE